MTIQLEHPVYDYTQGWPAHKGPLAVLYRLRLLKPGDRDPIWLRMPTVHTDSQGRTVYVCRPRYLGQDSARQLAALTFEGYLLGIQPTDRSEMKVRLILNEGTHD